MKNFSRLKASLIIIAILLAMSYSFATPPTPPVGYTWQAVVSDDFNSFNTSIWSRGSTPWGTESHGSCSLITPGNTDAWVSDGNLVLRSRKGPFTGESGTEYAYSSGWAWLNTWRTYGYIEIRAMYPNYPGAWPAFWMLGDGWPPEIDIAEWRGAPKNYMTLAYYDGSWSTSTLGGDYTGWHTYGLLWEAGSLKYYIDGVLRKTVNKSPSQSMYVILSAGTSCSDSDGTGFPNYFHIDYFRWYQLQSTGGGISNGRYRISPSHATNQALDMAGQGTTNGTNIQQWAYWGGSNQQWDITDAGSGYYYIRPANASGQSMDVDSWSTADGANIMSWAFAGGTNQQFQIVADGSGYNIKPRHSNKCLDIAGASTSSGANLLQWSCHGGANQRFILTRLSSTEKELVISETKIALYPNPVNGDIVTLKTILYDDSEVRISIYNIQGQLMFEKNIGIQYSGEFIYDLNIEKLSNGLYMIKVVSGNLIEKALLIRQ